MSFTKQDKLIHARERKAGEISSENVKATKFRSRTPKELAETSNPTPRQPKKARKSSAPRQPLVDPGHGAGDVVLLRGKDFIKLREAKLRGDALIAATVLSVAEHAVQCQVDGLSGVVEVGRGQEALKRHVRPQNIPR